MSEIVKPEGILKEEKIGYLLSKLNMHQGNLYLTSQHLVMDTQKPKANLFGLIGALLAKPRANDTRVFEMDLKNITKIEQGKHGLAKVLEVTTNENNTYRIIVKNYDEWEVAILQQKNR